MNTVKKSGKTTVKLVNPGTRVALAGAVPRTLSGSEAGRVVGFGCGCAGKHAGKNA